MSRLSPRRPTRSSPDRPEADSRPVNTTVATPTAKNASPHVGVEPRWIVSVMTSTSKNTTAPRTTTITWSTMSSITSAEIRCTRVRAKPPDAAPRDPREDPERDDRLELAAPERRPERGQVVRGRERRDRQQDHVVE